MPHPNANTSNVIELRQYTLHPGQRDVLIDIFEREFLEGQEEDHRSTNSSPRRRRSGDSLLPPDVASSDDFFRR